MPLDYNRIVSQSKNELVAIGLKPDDVPFENTGKGVLELIIEAVAKAVVDEFTANADVNTTVAAGIGVQVNTGTGTGATTDTGSGTGGIS